MGFASCFAGTGPRSNLPLVRDQDFLSLLGISMALGFHLVPFSLLKGLPATLLASNVGLKAFSEALFLALHCAATYSQDRCHVRGSRYSAETKGRRCQVNTCLSIA